MIKRKPPQIIPVTDEEDAAIRRAIAEDPDTWEFTGKTDDRPPPPYRVGRPRGSNKTRVTAFLDDDVLAALKQPQEKGWQTRMNATLRQALGL